ncbi:MAG: c-type cytochrome [Pirellulaceae bacterium]
MRFPAIFLLMLTVCLLTVGCDAPIERFPPNKVHALTLARSRGAETDLAGEHVTQVVTALFGSPDQPRWPADLLDKPAAKNMIAAESLVSAAGPVYSDREGHNFGLFNKHCVACHGVSGSGAGPASVFQNPYPRDFRAGIFKWKSTARNAKPTRDDLAELLHRGVPGTGMPSFALIGEADVQSLIDYLIYLSVRGESERLLLQLAIDELGYDDADGPPDERLARQWATDFNPNSLAEDGDVSDVVNTIVQQWVDAPSQIVPVPTETANDTDSIVRGKELFHGQIANCVGCHGPSGNGGAVTLDFDDWAKEYSSRLGLTPTNREAMKPFRDAGALRPRQIKPRQLNQGVFHGPGNAAAIYRQISQGIAGTPMPSVSIVDQPSATGLTSEQVWDLVHFVQSLGQTPVDALP